MVERAKVHLVGDGAHLDRHTPLPREEFGHRVARESEAVADSRRVQEQRVQHVLVHLCAFLVFRWSEEKWK